MAEFKKALAKSELELGKGKVVEMDGSQIAVFNVDGQFCAVDNTCPHRGGPLGEGDLSGKIVTCPLHGWEFDVCSGAYMNDPQEKIKVYEVKIEGEDVLVSI